MNKGTELFKVVKDNATSLFDWGKYYEKDGQVIMPVSVWLHYIKAVPGFETNKCRNHQIILENSQRNISATVRKWMEKLTGAIILSL